ncbi:MAG: hypothetical protein A3H32_09190 [Betaproteobacteria bacterium RIFCSPLOWO2_02_FULL_63_19]|nr:MAG: hypothetical protein A3H32_09190 [Betaproteobacteria bacterium RIFCSPLOWO2_02_FULL_63_19]
MAKYVGGIMRAHEMLLKNPLTVWIAWLVRTLALKFRCFGSHLRIGYMATAKRSRFGRFNTLYDHVYMEDVEIGDMSYVSHGSRIMNATIGKFTCVGPECLIGLGRHPAEAFVSSHPAFYSTLKQSQVSFVDEQKFEEFQSIRIGNDVWIGARAIILDGASIGDGAIVAAGAVVAGSVPPYAIVGGVPAKVVRHRFDEAVVAQLLASRWWELSLDTLRANAGAFASAADFMVWQPRRLSDAQAREPDR